MTNPTISHQDAVIADIQHKPGGAWRVRIFWFAGAFTAIVFSLMIVAGWHIIVTIAPYVVGLLSVVIVLCMVWLVYEMFQYTKTRHVKYGAERRIILAQADKAEAEARAAAFYSYSRSEGVIQHSPTGLNVLALPAQAGQNVLADQSASFDFYELMTQPKRAYALFGGQQTGKSTLMHHIVRFWQNEGVKPVVIGQKFDSFEYTTGVLRFGPDAQGIIDGFDLVCREAQARQELADQGTGFSDMTPLPVVLEDATSLGTVIDKNDYDVFTRQVLTVYAARMIVLYFVVHSTDIASFGLKVGAALKNHLVCLYFETPPDRATFNISDVTITGSIGYTQRGKERYPVTNLPYGFASLTNECEPGLYSLTMDVTPPTVMTASERDILRAYGNGESISAIAQDVFGAASTHNNGKIKDVLTKYDVPIRDARKREDIEL